MIEERLIIWTLLDTGLRVSERIGKAQGIFAPASSGVRPLQHPTSRWRQMLLTQDIPRAPGAGRQPPPADAATQSNVAWHKWYARVSNRKVKQEY